MNYFDADFYKGKRVLVTGHTGFKGSWLCRILVNAGAVVTRYSLNPPTPAELMIPNTNMNNASNIPAKEAIST